jgi:dephospho-CoA kinase
MRMIVFGLTGSIGMGKSTAGKMMARMGCPVYESDHGVRRALAPYGKAFEHVALAFPSAWDKKNRVINKEALANLIYADAGEKHRLESILHPIVQDEQHDFILKEKRLGRRAVTLDIPLLFETGAQERVDYTITVSAPHFIQRQRVLSRKGMSEAKLEKILEHQMPDALKCALSDFVVQTGLGKAYTYRELEQILRETL